MIALLLAACNVDVPRPTSDCDCALDFSSHPRHAALQAEIEARVDGGLPGLSVAVRTPEGLWAGAAGSANLEDTIAMNTCHLHHLASIAKTWYAALALRMQEDGAIDLDDQLNVYVSDEVLKDVPNADRVTLRQLMTHTSGIPDFNSDVSYITGELNDPTEENVPLDLVDEVRGKKALGDPGEVYTYADVNFVLLALALESVNRDNVAALTEQILEPLGLSATTVYTRSLTEPDCLCNTYWETGGNRLENVSDLSREYAIHDIGADGIAASPLDALTFVEALVRGDLLTEASKAELLTFTDASAGDDGYGYGLGIARTDTATGVMMGHTGGGVGVGAVMRADPDDEITFVAATNAGMFLGGPLTEQWNEELWDAIAAAAGLLDQTADP